MTKVWQKQIFLLPLLIGIAYQGVGQVDTTSDQIDEDGVQIMKEHTLKGGGFIHTNGWGLGIQYAKNQTRHRNTLYNFDLVLSLKHPKEVKKINPRYEQANPYVFGRENALMVARPGWGQQFRIAEKEADLGVRVDLNITAGPNLGLLKPVYIEVIKENREGDLYREVEQYDARKHANQAKIFGGASFLRGITEMDVQPGFSTKAGLSFAWDDFKSVEAGVMVDAFPRSMPIFAFVDNKQLFINLYLDFSFGKHW